ncbi:MAG: sirohydrochlorin chelatase [Pirellula sp.]
MTAPEGAIARIAAEVWSEFSRGHGALLVVGHGTRNQLGAAQFLNLVGQMKAKAREAVIDGCFLELAEPNIQQAIEAMRVRGIEKLLVVPVLLFSASHAQSDIPDAVIHAATVHGMQVIGQTDPLGTHPSLLSLSSTRYQELVALGRSARCPTNACARVQCNDGNCEASGVSLGRIGLAMVGRGTSNELALAHMRTLTELRVRNQPIEHFETGFFAGGKPDVDTLFDLADRWPCDTVVVQPHLLFEGELIDQLRNKVLERRLQQSDRNWLIARTLGADPLLAELFLKLAHDELVRLQPLFFG